MAERTMKSPGVSTREIDLSAPKPGNINGIPAGVIGTADEGKAFVPVTISNMTQFKAKFGEISGEDFGPLAAAEWLKNQEAITYTRILGAGNGKKRSASDGTVSNAGFVVGQREPNSTGLLVDNSYANAGGQGLGRVYFLGCFMSESAGSTVFSDAGFATSADKAHPILRGVIMAASGVVPSLSSSNTSDATFSNAPGAAVNSATIKGYTTGTMNIASDRQEFVMLLNGKKRDNVVTASFDPQASNYFGNLNSDPLKLEEEGYMFYTTYNINKSHAVVTGSGLTTTTKDANDCAFIMSSSLGRNAGSSTVPNFENFQNRFTTPSSPWVISQKFGGEVNNLFKIHALNDGAFAADKFKITVRNLKKSSPVGGYGTFDLDIRDFNDDDGNQIPLESYAALSLDPTSERYIARVIGDQNLYYDFDRNDGSQKLVSEGNYSNASSRVRVEIASSVLNGEENKAALPVGFRGHRHLVTSGSSIMNGTDILRRAIVPPIPMRENFGTNAHSAKKYSWGVQFEKKENLSNPNSTTSPESMIKSFTKYFPDFEVSNQAVWAGNNAGTADVSGTVLDSDKFNNNLFTLENVRVVTGSNGLVESKYSESLLSKLAYMRVGNIVANATDKTRAWNVNDVDSNNGISKFTFFMQGGFNGVDIFDKESAKLSNIAIKGEQDDSSRGLQNGNATASFRKALDIMKETADVDIQLLAVPGIRHEIVTDYAMDTVEDRFDALFIMDIEERNNSDEVIMNTSDAVNPTFTATAFNNRDLDTSFTAAYFPDVTIDSKEVDGLISVPPSVAVLGAFGFNDAKGYSHTAPAGFSRGALDSAVALSTTLGRENLDNLYEKRINPIVKFPNSGPTVFGQKTLQQAATALDRVNVRRLLIDVRRTVKRIAMTFIFEPNRASTLERFSSLVNPVLQKIQQQGGIDRFKVIIDTSTTTQSDVENNTVRGKIFMQPTKTAEFISLDFVVTNNGTEGI